MKENIQFSAEPNLSMVIHIAIVVAVIQLFFSIIERKKIEQIVGVLIKTEKFVLPLLVAEILPVFWEKWLQGMNYELACALNSLIFLILLICGECWLLIPTIRNIKEQQRVRNEEYYKRMEEFKRLYDPTPDNLLRVRADASPDYQKMTYRERAIFEVNRLISMSKSEKGVAFEDYVSRMLMRMGYSNVTLTRTTGDYGADIIAKDDQIVYAIQCKCYQNSIGIDAVYQVLGGASYYNANKLIVVTTGYFTGQAKELAQRSSVKLIDRNQLIDIIEKYYSELATNSTISKGF